MKTGTYQKGLGAEILTMASLIVRGYRILAWRYKTKVGEIDIIARRGRVVAFIEVKNRASMDEALFSLTPQMRRRIGQAARQYLTKKAGGTGLDYRFDLVAVSGFSVRHLDNAWMDTQ